MASVSRLRVVTRTAQAEHAVEIQGEGATRSELRPAAHVVGTTIEVRDLFFNVPARRKFVRTETTETGHIVRLVERLALSLATDVGGGWLIFALPEADMGCHPADPENGAKSGTHDTGDSRGAANRFAAANRTDRPSTHEYPWGAAAGAPFSSLLSP